MFLARLALLFAICAFSSLIAQTLNYSVLANGKTAGTETETYAPGGHIESAFEFNDRGRGPKVTAQYQFGADGLPVRMDVTGVDYLKAPVDEHFTQEGGMAHWHSTSEKGDAAAPGFYLSNGGSPPNTLCSQPRS